VSAPDPGQAARFFAAARQAEVDETGAEFERLFLRIALQQTTNTAPVAEATAATPRVIAPGYAK
jgi:hypothetical protein